MEGKSLMDRYTPLPNRSNLLTLRFFLYEHAGRVSRFGCIKLFPAYV